MDVSELSNKLQEQLSKASGSIEHIRSVEGEVEASLLFVSSTLQHPQGITQHQAAADISNNLATTITDGQKQSVTIMAECEDVQQMPGAVKDAWVSLKEACCAAPNNSNKSSKAHLLLEGDTTTSLDAPIPKGPLPKAVVNAVTLTALDRIQMGARSLINDDTGEFAVLDKTTSTVDSLLTSDIGRATNTMDLYLASFYQKLHQVREYHAKHGLSSSVVNQSATNPRKRKYGNAEADGFDLSSFISSEAEKVREGEYYSVEEVFGKYLDLSSIYETHFVAGSLRIFFLQNNNNGYADFLQLLMDGFDKIPEKAKLRDRKKYLRFLIDLQTYLQHFLRRSSPFLSWENALVKPAIEKFENFYKNKDGKSSNIPSEGGEDGDPSKGCDSSSSLDLSQYESPELLEKALGGERLKMELIKLGMKCGGKPLDRAKRLFLIKDTPLSQLPKKLFVGGKSPPSEKKNTNATPNSRSIGTTISNNNDKRAVVLVGGESKYAILRMEASLTALLNHLKPVLDATTRRAERRLTQTVTEREREDMEEMKRVVEDIKQQQKQDQLENSDDEEEEIYNPKDVPLGWDGKPIPYWLFKLHGLNHYYSCEICGNESYRGRRDFEKHFSEAKHSYGMRCLGIPNTQHLHGITKIADAQNLWQQLQQKVQLSAFDGNMEEEYEDSNGNVLSRNTYEDLARQGLL